MSATIGYVAALAQYGLDSILIRPRRGIGHITAQVTIEETHHDDLEITDHPVEQGAIISDHAYKRPAELVIRAGWSDSPSVTGLIAGVVAGVSSTVSGFQSSASRAGVNSRAAGNSGSQVRDIYAALLKLQTDRTPFDVFTGKRVYTNMLLKALSVTTDAKTEHALMVTATLRQVLVARTQTVTLTADALRLANPASTQTPVNGGARQITNPTPWVLKY